MVSKIVIAKSIEKALNYNEQKLQKGQAECIHAGNFYKDKNDMNFYEKLERFTDLIERNDRAKTNSLHISLNFDSSEKLTTSQLKDIATTYMEKIGFGHQPYLVYQHHDAGHPHVHIVTTNIKTDGSRINTHNIGRNQSEKARKEIENDFGLVKASSKHFREATRIPPVEAEKIIYGKSETKRAITNVLDTVIKQYKYTSLAELNAILRQYNVMADRGQENSVAFKNGGLVYRVLDKEGNKVGVPIKASSIYSKPTLADLEKRFPENEEARKLHRPSVKERIDKALEAPASFQAFIAELRKKGIETVLRHNDQSLIYGITFVDHNTKTVFNGSDLGKIYSASAIQHRLREAVLKQLLEKQKSEQAGMASTISKSHGKENVHEESPGRDTSISKEMLYQLLKAESNSGHVPYELIKKKKKKKRRNLGL